VTWSRSRAEWRQTVKKVWKSVVALLLLALFLTGCELNLSLPELSEPAPSFPSDPVLSFGPCPFLRTLSFGTRAHLS
jgi:hypothetical protein